MRELGVECEINRSRNKWRGTGSKEALKEARKKTRRRKRYGEKERRSEEEKQNEQTGGEKTEHESPELELLCSRQHQRVKT
jgi:hypothetical protein